MSAIGDLSGNVAVPMKTSVSDPKLTFNLDLGLFCTLIYEFCFDILYGYGYGTIGD